MSLLAGTLAMTSCSRSREKVVVYCAQDREYAEAIFADFESQTGIQVVAKFDTEATKSVGLAAEIQAEAGRPRCDLHWNNEIVSTIRLATNGVYEPITSKAIESFPEWSRPADRLWQAFASRARVLIVNTKILPDESNRPTSLFDLTDPKWKGKVGMAKPQFGTTATHAACLFEALGPEKAQEWYRGLLANDVRILSGNKMVARAVSAGEIAIGMTDTDDALIELNDGHPVTLIYPDGHGEPRHPHMGTLFIPNTLALVKGGPNPKAAERLLEYLLSPEIEARLASGGGFQIPLNPQVNAQLPKGLMTPSQVRPLKVDFARAAGRWELAQNFLRDQFAR